MKRIIVLLLILSTLAGVAFAHSGKTDSAGGHHVGGTSEYHYHHGYPAHQHTNGECPYDFDDKTGSSSGSSSSGSSKPEPKPSSSFPDPAPAPEPVYGGGESGKVETDDRRPFIADFVPAVFIVFFVYLIAWLLFPKFMGAMLDVLFDAIWKIRNKFRKHK